MASVVFVAWLWALGAIVYFPIGAAPIRWIAAAIWIVGTIVHLSRSEKRWKLPGVLLGVAIVWMLLRTVVPSNQRPWTPDQARLAHAVFLDNTVMIENVRNSRYRSEDDYDVIWETRSYDLRQLETVDFVVEPFSSWRGLAHVFLTFGFSDGEHIAISVEIRKERGESFSPLRGLYRHYEIAYVVGDERDLIGLRTNIRHDPVDVFPVRTSPEKARELFISMLRRVDTLGTQPEFYHSLFNTCSSNVLRHVNQLRSQHIGFDWRIVFPGYADELAWKHDLIAWDGTLEEARARFLVNDRSAFDDSVDGRTWSARLRAAPESAANTETSIAADVTQILLCVAENHEATRGTLRCFERAGTGWRAVHQPIPALLGGDGLAWGRGILGSDEPGLQKTEGDNRTPAGAFAIGRIFGYAAAPPPGATLPYHQVTASDAWVDDPDDPQYNRHVVAGPDTPAAWHERFHMRLNDPAFQWMLEVRHNADPPQTGAGSAIFLHIRRSPDRTTSGCTALPKEDLLTILQWLRPECHPLYVLLAREDYERLKLSWGLPETAPPQTGSTGLQASSVAWNDAQSSSAFSSTAAPSTEPSSE